MSYNGSQAQAGRGSSLSIGGSALSAPGTVTATPSTTGGTLAAATHYYVVTALGGGGETGGSPEATGVTTGSTGSVGLAWAAVTSATGYRIYRGATAGTEDHYFTSATNSFTDVGSAGTSGTVPSGEGTLIGEVNDSPLQRGQWQFDDVTNFQSDKDKEVISTIRDTGSVPFKVNRIGSDAGQLLVEAAYQSGALNAFTLQLPQTPDQTVEGDRYVFSAYVKSSKLTVETTKKIGLEIDLMTTGPISFVAGS
jgi:hypothetical protein